MITAALAVSNLVLCAAVFWQMVHHEGVVAKLRHYRELHEQATKTSASALKQASFWRTLYDGAADERDRLVSERGR